MDCKAGKVGKAGRDDNEDMVCQADKEGRDSMVCQADKEGRDSMVCKAGNDSKVCKADNEVRDSKNDGGGMACELLEFLTACGTPYKMLVLEGLAYLPRLREMFPAAELWCALAAAEDADDEAVQGLGVHWVFTDYLSEPLPLEREFFDYIIAGDCLAQSANPQDIASGLGLYLKPTGYLLMSFANIRHWRIIQQLMEGHFYHVCTRAFTHDEMTKLLAASFYKDVQFLPVEGSRPPSGFVERLEGAGFQNINNDLLIKSWLVRAAKSTPEIMELKRMYTPELRQRLAVLLRRLEYGIAEGAKGENNLVALWQLCQDNMVFPAYLAAFIKETVVHTNALLWRLSSWGGSSRPEQQDFWAELLEEMAAAEMELMETGAMEIEPVEIEPVDMAPVDIADVDITDVNVADVEIEPVGMAPVSEGVSEGRQDLQMLTAWRQGRPEPLPPDTAPCLRAGAVVPGTKIAFITCVNRPELYEEALLYMKQLRLPEGMEAEFIPVEGAASMCSGYNQAMAKTQAAYKVYVHQDTLIVNKNFIFDLLNLFEDKTIGAVGMIGARKLPSSGVWWDAMRTYGRVLHACEPECVVETACMEPEQPWIEVEAVDGLLLAAQVDLPWREDLFDGWHFYEVSMCKELQRRGYKVAVPRQESFWCIHCPKEKPLAASYKVYQKRFLREYGGELNPEV